MTRLVFMIQSICFFITRIKTSWNISMYVLSLSLPVTRQNLVFSASGKLKGNMFFHKEADILLHTSNHSKVELNFAHWFTTFVLLHPNSLYCSIMFPSSAQYVNHSVYLCEIFILIGVWVYIYAILVNCTTINHSVTLFSLVCAL